MLLSKNNHPSKTKTGLMKTKTMMKKGSSTPLPNVKATKNKKTGPSSSNSNDN